MYPKLIVAVSLLAVVAFVAALESSETTEKKLEDTLRAGSSEEVDEKRYGSTYKTITYHPLLL